LFALMQQLPELPDDVGDTVATRNVAHFSFAGFAVVALGRVRAACS
jgi:hypothetical protein